MKLRNRLALGLLAIAIVLLVPLLVALRSLERLHDGAADLRDSELAASFTLGRLRGALDDLRQSETALLFVHDTATRDTMLAHLGRVAALADSLDAHALGAAASRVRTEVRTRADAEAAEFDAALAGRAAAADSISTGRVVPAIGRAERTPAAAEAALAARTRARVAAAA
ncbi:MAG TPA: hypothetical protein VNA89_00175, partial [Gemmatimonadaceae bacterium]|nr:hypothetical protein [Gemmatimonadaceae bacterium]